MDSGYMPNFKSIFGNPIRRLTSYARNNEGLYAWAPMIRKPDSPLVFNGNMIKAGLAG